MRVVAELDWEFFKEEETGMKASLFTGNKNFDYTDVEEVLPGTGEVQVKVAYCGICGTDLHIYQGAMAQRLTLPQAIGHEISGTVAKVGTGVAGLEKGDKVTVRPLDPCGNCPACRAGHSHICHNLKFMGIDTIGGFQEYWTVPAHTIHKLPEQINLETAALIEPLAVACHDVRMSRLKEGEDVVVIGGGPIGILVALVAKHSGANVIISEVSDYRLAIAGKLGFKTVNPLSDDVAGFVNEETGGKGAEVVFEVSGVQPGVDTMTQLAATRGRIVIVAIHAEKKEVDLFRFFWRELELIGVRVYEPEDFDRAIALIAGEEIDLGNIITEVKALDEVKDVFESTLSNPQAMKSVVKCSQ